MRPSVRRPGSLVMAGVNAGRTRTAQTNAPARLPPVRETRPIPASLPRLSALPEQELQAEILRRIRVYDLDDEPDAIVERAL
ncbi:MAG: hypothetical protein QOI64_2256, partial [Solirubrobacteraceae bacterium]|nr:hypothetical protein [Solirubrobacteraceae bacterium]